jgi:hypothetical protein
VSDHTGILVNGRFGDALTNLAVKERYARLEVGHDEIYGGSYSIDSRGNRRNFGAERKSVLQMLLVYDKMSIVSEHAHCYDWRKIESTGIIDVISSLDDPTLSGAIQSDDSTRRYALFLKPMVIPSLLREDERDSRSFESLFTSHELRLYYKEVLGIDKGVFYSELYDHIFSKSPVENGSRIHRIFQLINSSSLRDYTILKKLVPEYNLDQESYLTSRRQDWTAMILSNVGQLMFMIERSMISGSVVLQSRFELNKSSTDLQTAAAGLRSTKEPSYGILRFAAEEAIGTLPNLETIDDVLRLKDKRANDIRRLREVLDIVDSALRESKHRALIQARDEVSRASAELTQGNNAARVNKWIGYLSLPVSVLETLFSFPPITGLTLGVFGVGASLHADSRLARSRWLQIIR